MEEAKEYVEAENIQYFSARIRSSEIVEIGEDDDYKNSVIKRNCDVYVVVGKDDMNVLKWALDHVVSPGAHVFLVHVFSPISYINTPVGKLARSQLSQEQVRVYINEENNRRRSLLHKYIRLCNDAKVSVDTMLLESDVAAKTILELISVVNITKLVIGTKRPLPSRLLGKKLSKGEYVKQIAPHYCEVMLVPDDKYVSEDMVHSYSMNPCRGRTQIPRRQPRISFFECVCLSSKMD